MRYVLLTVAVFALAGAGSVLAGDKPVESVTKGAGHGVSAVVNAPGKIVKNTVTTSNPIATGTKKATDSAIEGTVGGVAAKGLASGTEGVARTATSGVVPKGAGNGVSALVNAPKKILENVITTTNPIVTGTKKVTDAAIDGAVGGVVAKGMAGGTEGVARIVTSGVVPKGAGGGVSALVNAPKKILENVITTTNPIVTGTKKVTDAAIDGAVGGVVAKGMAGGTEGVARIVTSGVVPKGAGQGVKSLVEAPILIIKNIIRMFTGTRKD